MRGIHFSIFYILILFCPFISLFAETTDEEILKLGEEAIAHYEQGDYERAILKFNTILLARPNDSQALKLRQLAGDELMMKMLAEGGELSRVARALLLYAEKAPIRQEKDPATIKKLVLQAATGSLFARNEAITLLQTQVGERAIPEMLPYLASKTQERERINIILAATKMGRAAVVPLTEALKTDDVYLKQQIVILLGHMGDGRCVANLKAITEDPKTLPEVKQYARESLRKLTNKTSIALPAAKELFYRKGLRYYQEHPKYMPIHFANWLDWRWEKGKLVYKEVPNFAYNEIMAEHCSHEALDIDPTFKKGWGLLAQVYYAQHTEITAIEEAAKDRDLELPTDELNQFLEEKKISDKAKSLSRAFGYPLLIQSLKMSFRNDRPEVTKQILNEIGNQGSKQNVLNGSLIQALKSKDKRIRYAAAEAIVKINPPGRFRDADTAIKVLVEALSESDARVILVVEDDDETRNRLINIIRGMNMVAFGASTGSEGLQRAKAFPPEDLVIVSSQLEDMATSYFVNSMREDYRTKKIPVMIICPEGQEQKHKDLYKEIDIVKGVVTEPFAPEKTKLSIREHLVDSNTDYKGKSREIARRAASAIASIPAGNRVFNVRLAQEALADAIRTRHDSIREPAIHALKKFGDTGSTDALRETLYNNSSSIHIRTLTASALGSIFNRQKIKVPSEDVDKLMLILQEKLPAEENDLNFDEKIGSFHDSIYTLLGQSDMSAADKRKVFFQHRIHKEIGVVQEKQEETGQEDQQDQATEDREKTDEEEDIWKDDSFGDSSGSSDDYGSDDDYSSEGDSSSEDSSSEDSGSDYGDDDYGDDDYGNDDYGSDDYGDDDYEDDYDSGDDRY